MNPWLFCVDHSNKTMMERDSEREISNYGSSSQAKTCLRMPGLLQDVHSLQEPQMKCWWPVSFKKLDFKQIVKSSAHELQRWKDPHTWLDISLEKTRYELMCCLVGVHQFRERTMALPAPVYHPNTEEWVWPTISEIKQHQHAYGESEAMKCISENVVVYEDIILIHDRKNLRLRICIAQHCGLSGHTTVEREIKRSVEAFFNCTSMSEDWRSLSSSHLRCREKLGDGSFTRTDSRLSS